MSKGSLVLTVWSAAALCLPMLVAALQPVSPAHVDAPMRHPSLAAEQPLAIEIGNAHLGSQRRSPAPPSGPIWMRGARLVGTPENTVPMMVAQKPTRTKSAHAD